MLNITNTNDLSVDKMQLQYHCRNRRQVLENKIKPGRGSRVCNLRRSNIDIQQLLLPMEKKFSD